ncbi:MAG TPA: anthranilate synthase component I [Ruminococcus sp.]|nr:anthranilate synthase component I [Ruminococcus sp.]
MIKPDFSVIDRLSKEYKIIPVCREIYADVITPITLLRKIANNNERYFLLESVEQGDRWGRYSFLGFDPIVRITCKNNIVTVEKDGEKVLSSLSPYETLRNIMSEYKAPKLEDMPTFTGGLVGYFSYAMIGYAEPVLKLQESDFNDYDFMLFDRVIAYDHLKQKICIVVNMKTDNPDMNYSKALNDIHEMEKIISDMPAGNFPVTKKPEFRCSVSKKQYCEMVEKTKKYITDGDIFQAVISRRFECDYNDSLINAYRVLRTTNPSPYMVFMKTDDIELMSTSPETLVKMKDGVVTTFPIAGSRPRGITPEEDRKLEEGLLKDEKELAEHNMLVDLGRNDIGKISEIGTVKVTEYMKVLKYSKIMHICSEVTGKLRENYDAYDCVESILPAGTLSGAPKIRACEIIEETETQPRGIYGGALGYIDFTGNLDTCIAIRMAVKKNNKVYIQAGGGIVADSIPENEYLESENKAKACINAILDAMEVND